MQATRHFLLLMCLLFCAEARAQFSIVACPAAVLSADPNALCRARSDFTFLVFGSLPVATPSQACVTAGAQLTQAGNIPTSCQFDVTKSVCACSEDGVTTSSSWNITTDPASLAPICPADSVTQPTTLVSVTGPEGFHATMPLCLSSVPPPPVPAPAPVPPTAPPPVVCPVAPLTGMTDLIALQNEAGKYSAVSDLEHSNAATVAGLSCLRQRAAASGSKVFPVLGYRPTQYQAHLKEVWDDWHLLKDDSRPECKAQKDALRGEWLKHKLVRSPVASAAHAGGAALDLAGVTPATIDALSGLCNIFRPDALGSPLHVQPVTK